MANFIGENNQVEGRIVNWNPAPDLYPNCFEAEVEDIIFMGDHLRIHATLFGGNQFIVKIPNIIGHGGILPGDTVTLGWLVTDCRALNINQLAP